MATSPIKPKANITERQEQWFAAVKAGLEKETGKSFAEWVKIAKKCPETKPRARTKWMKDTHGIGINRASVIFSAAFEGSLGWDNPDALKDALWKDDAQRLIVDTLEKAIAKFDGVTIGQRKTFTAFSRKVQFAAIRPHQGEVRLGVAVDAGLDRRFEAPLKNEGWSDRLKASTVLAKPGDIDARLMSFLKQAWEAA